MFINDIIIMRTICNELPYISLFPTPRPNVVHHNLTAYSYPVSVIDLDWTPPQ